MALPCVSISKSLLPVPLTTLTVNATATDSSIPISSSASASTLVHFPTKRIPYILSSSSSSSSSHKLSFSSGQTIITTRRGISSKPVRVSFFPSFLTQKKDANAIKEELLQALQPLDRGANATPQDQDIIDQLTRKLEAVNPTKEPLKSDLLNGKWELIYTTSKSILQTERPKFLRSRVNYQAINLDTLRAQNMETWPFFNQVTADLTPVNSRKVAVKFDYFKILGLLPVKAPDRARGSLEITYLDEDLRVSRGDKGNLFILKIVDRSYRIPTKKT